VKKFYLFCLVLIFTGCIEKGDQTVETRTQRSTPKAQMKTPDDHSGLNRPNILLIVADDLGYSDLGIYGSEIKTPNLDALAMSGIMLTDFHAAPLCSVTRAMLMSGTDNHLAGLGTMAETQRFPLGEPGYEGYLNFRVATLAELMADAGYNTYMTGKWHLGLSEELSPAARGFDKSFALTSGGAAHLDGMSVYGPASAGTEKARYRENGKLVGVPDKYYTTRFFTEKMIEYIDSQKNDSKPFFGYLAYTAPHWPLQAPDESRDKYKGVYDEGYDALAAQRLTRMKKLKLAPKDAMLYPRWPGQPAWEDLSAKQKTLEARKMELYAAMVDDLDVYVGRVLTHLQDIGEYDNTIIVFISDNGPEYRTRVPPILAEWYDKCCDFSFENMGKTRSWVMYGPNWARASAGHLRSFKGHPTEGGIRVPAIISYPELSVKGIINDSFASVLDLMPTFLELAGAEHPGTTYKGRQIHPISGESMLAGLIGTSNVFHGPDYVMGWESVGSGAIRQGDWKMVRDVPPLGTFSWQLYNIAQDPQERYDVTGENPAKVTELKTLWGNYTRDNGVIALPFPPKKTH